MANPKFFATRAAAIQRVALSRREFGRVSMAGALAAVMGTFAGKSSASISNPYVYGASSTALPRWVAARQRVLSGQGIARVLFLGDSTVFGSGSSDQSSETGANLYRYSAPTQLADFLAFMAIPTHANGIAFGPSGARLTVNGGGHDPRVTNGSSWSPYWNAPSLGGHLATSSTPTNALNFTPDNPCDMWRVAFVQGGTHGIVNASVDAGPFNGFSTGGGSIRMGEFTYQSAGGTLHLQNAGTSPVYVGSIEAWNSQASSVVITNAGWSGARLGDFSSAYWTRNGYDPLSAALAFAPDVYIVEAGINDWYKGTPVSTFASQLNAFLSSLYSVADVVLVSGEPSNPGACSTCSTSNQQAFVTTMKNAAASFGIPFIDNWDRFGSWYNNNRMLYSASPALMDLHPNMAGYLRFSELIAQTLAGV